MKIGIIGAMEPEIALLKEQMTIERTYEQAHMQFVEGLLGEVPVVVVQSGIGKVKSRASRFSRLKQMRVLLSMLLRQCRK